MRFKDEHAVLNMGRGTAIILPPDRAAGQHLIDAGATGCLKMGQRTLRVLWVRV